VREIVYRTIKGEVRPVQALEPPPLVFNIVKQFTGEEPQAAWCVISRQVLARPGVLAAGIARATPTPTCPRWASPSKWCTTATRRQRASGALAGAARLDRRAEFVGDIPSPREALATAAAAPNGPIVLMDVGDNIGGGSAADSTVILAEAKRLGIRRFLPDALRPGAVAACVAAGVGNTLTLAVGGKTDRLHGEPVEVTGYVRLIGDGIFEDWRPTHGGQRHFDGGTSVVLETTDGTHSS